MTKPAASVDHLDAEQRRALAILLKKRKGVDLFSRPIRPAPRPNGAPLSYAQERLWFLWQLEPTSAAYNIAAALRLRGELRVSSLQRAVDDLVGRHESLRTTFESIDGVARQVVRPVASFPLRVVAVDRSRSERWGAVAKVLQEETHAPFDLESGPLLRVLLISRDEGEYVLVVTIHHIVADGWSMNVIVRELCELYRARVEGDVPRLDALPIQYADFAVWERSRADAGGLDDSLRFWKMELAGDVVHLDLPTRSGAGTDLTEGGRKVVMLSREIVATLRERARERDATPFMVLLAAFDVLLYRYTGQTDLRVGVPVANRHRVEIEGLIGSFVNTIVVRTRVHGGLRFDALLARVREAVLSAQANQDVPLQRVVDALRADRVIDEKASIFQVTFNHLPRAAGLSDRVAGLTFEPEPLAPSTPQFELSLDTQETNDGEMVASFEYPKNRFDEATIDRLATNWLRLLEHALRDGAAFLRDLSLSSEANEAPLRPCVPRVRDDAELLVHELVARAAAGAPETVAVVCGEARISYKELDRRANQIAHRLLRASDVANPIVAMVVDRSVEMFAGLLGILKTGGAFLPLDPELPHERLRETIEDAGASILVVDRRALATMRALASQLPTVLVDDVDTQGSSEDPRVAVHADDLAYIIYTSGSTGRPKGVAVSHRALSMHVRAIADLYEVTPADTALQFASTSFDAAIEQWTVPLVRGARLVARGRDLGSLEETYATLIAENVTMVDFLPSYAAALAAWCLEGDRQIPLRLCVVGGEALTSRVCATLHRAFPAASIINAYGPTEAVVTPLARKTLPEDGSEGTTVAIGDPIGARTAHILDGDLNRCPMGSPGHLYIGGAGLARGYPGRPALTAERFVPDPWGEPGSRLYRTGDRARYRPDGGIEFLGRSDDQVKVRGHRVELGEIEVRLLSSAEVVEAVAALQGDDGENRLVAYVVPRGAATGELAARLKEELSRNLPAYMVPSVIAVCDALPRGATGKIDRRALPAIERRNEGNIAPRTGAEIALANIWQSVLRLETVGVTDNFFELGGDSILSLQVVSRAKQAGLVLTPKDLFQYPTIEGLARAAGRAEQTAQVAPNRAAPHGEVDLTPIQTAFFEEAIPDRHWYNQSVLLTTRARVERERLVQVLQALLDHHDGLRLRFQHRNGVVVQSYRRAEEVDARDAIWSFDSVEPEGVSLLAADAQCSLDLEKGPLFRVVMMRMTTGETRLLLIAHHLVVDGVSWRILLNDLATAYRQSTENRPVDLGPRSSSLQAWSRRLRELAEEGHWASQWDHWEAMSAGAASPFPTDFASTEPLRRDRDAVAMTIEAATTTALLRAAPRAYRTQVQELLLTALARAVARWTGDVTVHVELEGHGREHIDDDLDVSRTVGWFTSVYPVRLSVDEDIARSILAVKEELRRTPERGIAYGSLRYLSSTLERERACRWSRPRITFNYLGRFDRTLGEASSFELTSGHAGDEQSPNGPLANWLELNGQVYDGVLSFSCTFSRKMFRRETVQRLMGDFRSEIVAIARHCVGPAAGGVSPSDFPFVDLSASEIAALPFPPRSIEDILPLTPMQRGMLFHAELSPDEPIYVTQIDAEVTCVDPDRLREAWAHAVQTFAVLRTAFIWRDVRQPVQVVLDEVPLEFEMLDWRAATDRSERLLLLRREQRVRPFRLDAPPLQRVALVRVADDRFHLIWTSHHLLLDGWSSSLVLAEVVRFYRRSTTRHVAATPSLPAARDATPALSTSTHREYFAWLSRRERVADETFWRARLRRLADGPTLLAPALGHRGATEGSAREIVSLDEQTAARLRALAQKESVTPNIVVQAVWTLLLSRYTARRTVTFGATVSGRPASVRGSEHWVGLFINTLPIVGTVSPELTVGDWLRTLRDAQLEQGEYEGTPLYDIQRWAGNGKAETLFDTIVVFENYPIADAIEDRREGPCFERVRADESTNYPLTLIVRPGVSWSIVFDYQLRHFTPEAMGALAGQFDALLRRILVGECDRVGELAILTTREAEQVAEWNHIARRYPRDATVATYISRRAGERPESDAVIGEKSRIDFRTLERRSNQLARRLRRDGVTRESIVAVAAQRSPSVIVAMLAVWKAGGAYVSLDPSYPQDRVRYMLEDSRASLVLTERRIEERAPWLGGSRTLRLDDPSSYDEVDSPLVLAQHPADLAYVVYTSGSTGTPKGVAVSHGALVMHSLAAGEIYGMSPDDAALHFASMSFDAAIEQWVVPLMHGARLVLSGDEPWTAQRTALALERERVTVIYPPTSFLLRLAEWIEERGASRLPRVCCVGGEAVARETYDRIRRVLQPDNVINGYGPTETVITPLLWNAGCATVCETAYAPIGRAVGERTSYIVDADMNLTPFGAVGELVIGGEGLARGYLGRPDWTAERFVPNPFDGRGGRLYRTGDLVRYRAGGVVEYVGRADGQVKVRGLRIELGEIEAHLLRDDRVREAVVVLREENERKRLVGYVAARDGSSLRAEDLRGSLAERLPDHMVPATIVLVDALPRTPNGKIDRKALPAIEAAHRAYVEPVSAFEKTLALVWQEVLGIEQVGATDHFFELGGDSIVSIQLVSRARLAGLRITPKDVFQHPTLRALAAVARPHAERSRKHELAPPRGEAALLPIQATFFRRVARERHWWNQSLLLEPRETLDVAPLRRAVSELIGHHDSLRLRYEQRGGAWTQFYADFDRAAADRVVEEIKNIAPSDVERISRNAQQSLDLGRGPLFRAVLMSLGDGTQRLLLVVHHLVVDGVSSRILLEDLERAYLRARADQSLDLPPRTTSFQAWAAYLEAFARSRELGREISFWEEMLPRDDELPRDGSTEPPTRRDALSVSIALDRERTTKLLRDAPAAYRTQINDLLLTALGRALARFTGRPAVHVELEGHGREDLADDLDLSRTVGWFTTTFPIKLPVLPGLGDNVVAVKEQLRAVPRRGLGFGLLEQKVPAACERFAKLARPRVTFNYLGQFDATFGEGTLFRPARESAGDDRSPDAPLANWIEINGQTFEGRLLLEWTFAESMFRRETVARVAEDCRQELERIVDHCTNDANGGVSPSDFALSGLPLDALRRLPIAPRAIEDVYPLTPLQQGMLFHVLAEPEASLYVTQLDVALDACDPPRLLAAWRRAIANHPILRTAFVWKDLPHPVQVVQKHAPFDFDMRDVHGGDAARVIDEVRRTERARCFSFDRPPLQRVVLVHMGLHRYHLVWTSHHLLLDGWSSSLLLSEILEAYAHLSNAGADDVGSAAGPSAIALRDSVGQYRDYLAWLAGCDGDVTERFWRAKLEGREPTLLGAALPPARGGGTARKRTRVSAAETTELQRFARGLGITTSTLVQGALALTLARYTGAHDVVFGLTVSGRPAGLPGVDAMLGLFINTIPVVARCSPDAPVGGWLRALHEASVETNAHDHAPLYDIQRWSGTAGRPLFDTLLVFENYPAHRVSSDTNGALQLGEVQTEESTNYPLTIGVASGDTLDLMFEYDRAHFDDASVARFGEHFAHLLREVARDALRALGTLALARGETAADRGSACAPSERAKSASFDASYATRSIEEAIAHVAATRPEAIALESTSRRMTYATLHREAGFVARALIEHGAHAETVVAVSMRRVPEAIVAMLGIWRAGAAFLPVDPAYPRDRVRAMLAASGATLLVTNSDDSERDDDMGGITRMDLGQIRRGGSDDPTASVSPNALAYVIATSGSTGTPKAVGVPRGALLHHARAISSLYETTSADTALHFASWSFDAAIEQWVVPLLAGARLVISDDEIWPVERLVSEIERRHLTQIDLPPAYLADLARYLVAESRTLDLRLCVVGGEALPADVYDTVRRVLPRTRIVNAYGPTEAVVTPMAWSPGPDASCATKDAPIGVPVGDRAAYVLDGALNPLPPGVVGELWIGGAVLARGYLGRPDLTALHFVPDPAGPPGARMYRTGDRARWLENGDAEYLGRSDDQVKLRGFRIELGEIEMKLRAAAAVESAVAVVRDDRIVAYVVDAKEDALPGQRASEIREALRAVLPSHMVPAAVVLLPKLPRTASGKIDRKALPPPNSSPMGAPLASPLEVEIAGVWTELLGVDAVGRDDHFFEIGGHSLRALAFVTRVQQLFGVELSLARFLARPTIAAVGDFLQGRAPRSGTPLVPLSGSGATHMPLFCLHAAGGTIFAYDEVARKIAPERPVIGILCRSFVESSFEDTSLEAMTHDYAALLCEAQPEGAFSLLGWSLGGALAVGVAHHLEQMGRVVEFLGFVDGFVPNVPTSRHGDTDVAEPASDLTVEEPGTPSHFRPEDVAAGRAVMNRLTRLASHYALPRVRVPLHCWWASETANDAMLAQQTLERTLRQIPRWSAIVPSTHTTILRSEEFLESLRLALRSAPTTSPVSPRNPR